MNSIIYYSPEEIERAFFIASQNQNQNYVRFILLWASFNSRISRDSEEVRDADMIRWVKRNCSRYRRRFQELIENDNEFVILFNQLQNVRVINFLEFKKRAKAIREGTQRQDQPEFKQIRRGREFSSLMDVIYLVRCNLIHGSKNIEQPGEIELAEICYYILLKLYRDDIEELIENF